jgi:siderophore ferric iron reductase
MWTGSTEQMIARAGAQLRAMTDDLLQEVNAVEKLRPLLAHRLLAERMLGLMLWLGQRQRELTIEQIEAYAAQWLAVFDLEGQGTLERVNAEGRRLLIVKRKGCCLDYRIDPDRLCANCPKQGDAVRVGRQVANALAEVG